MYGVTVQTRKPRNPEQYEVIAPKQTSARCIAGVTISVTNERSFAPIYAKWRI